MLASPVVPDFALVNGGRGAPLAARDVLRHRRAPTTRRSAALPAHAPPRSSTRSSARSRRACIAASSFACALATGAFATAAWAVEQPLWEAGLGAGGLWLPDYRGSDESRGYVLPFPYLIYRGDIFKADREGVRAEFLDTDRIRFEVAVNASQPVRSSSNQARQGMPDLRGSFELGPAIVVTLARSDDRSMKLDLRVPASAGVTLGGGFRSIGWQTSPRLNLDVFDVGGLSGVNLGLVAGPVFQDRRRDAYFYDVAAEYARPGRPAYRSRGGYAGAQFIAALSKRFDRWWVGGFVRADTLAGASFEDSPLVRRKSYVAAGIGAAWVFGQSKETVDVSEEAAR